MLLKQSATRYKKKSKTISRDQTSNLLKHWLLFLVSRKGQKRDESELVT